MLIIYSSNPNFKPIELDVKCELGEYVLMEDEKLPEWAYWYARGILHCRWADIGKPEVEDVIGRGPRWAYHYAADVLKCRWADIGKPEIEDIIGRDPMWAHYYAVNILHCKWSDIGKQEIEDRINKDLNWNNIYNEIWGIEC